MFHTGILKNYPWVLHGPGLKCRNSGNSRNGGNAKKNSFQIIELPYPLFLPFPRFRPSVGLKCGNDGNGGNSRNAKKILDNRSCVHFAHFKTCLGCTLFYKYFFI